MSIGGVVLAQRLKQSALLDADADREGGQGPEQHDGHAQPRALRDADPAEADDGAQIAGVAQPPVRAVV